MIHSLLRRSWAFKLIIYNKDNRLIYHLWNHYYSKTKYPSIIIRNFTVCLLYALHFCHYYALINTMNSVAQGGCCTCWKESSNRVFLDTLILTCWGIASCWRKEKCQQQLILQWRLTGSPWRKDYIFFFYLTWYAHKYYTCTLNKAKTVHSPVYDDLGFFVIHRRLWEFRLDNNKLSWNEPKVISHRE